mmetsp:Transcript_34816/g.55991  ORF Transcript_34816/g.55991 Transcript_34816/m.55991 type:complete len:246 (-) Transcript_34816:1213-1950(-)
MYGPLMLSHSCFVLSLYLNCGRRMRSSNRASIASFCLRRSSIVFSSHSPNFLRSFRNNFAFRSSSPCSFFSSSPSSSRTNAPAVLSPILELLPMPPLLEGSWCGSCEYGDDAGFSITIRGFWSSGGVGGTYLYPAAGGGGGSSPASSGARTRGIINGADWAFWSLSNSRLSSYSALGAPGGRLMRPGGGFGILAARSLRFSSSSFSFCRRLLSAGVMISGASASSPVRIDPVKAVPNNRMVYCVC